MSQTFQTFLDGDHLHKHRFQVQGQKEVSELRQDFFPKEADFPEGTPYP